MSHRIDLECAPFDDEELIEIKIALEAWEHKRNVDSLDELGRLYYERRRRYAESALAKFAAHFPWVDTKGVK